MSTDSDYRLAFEMAPIGLVLSKNRIIVDCNSYVCDVFHASREILLGASFRELYPTTEEFERLGRRIAPIPPAARGERGKCHRRHSPAHGAGFSTQFHHGLLVAHHCLVSFTDDIPVSISPHAGEAF